MAREKGPSFLPVCAAMERKVISHNARLMQEATRAFIFKMSESSVNVSAMIITDGFRDTDLNSKKKNAWIFTLV